MPSKYAILHVTPGGPGDVRPTAREIVKDEGLEGKLNDKVILITGCSSGIGIETARALLATGAVLYLTARNLAKAAKALGGLLESDKVHLLELDLNSLASVRACANSFLSESKTLNIIINNAGVMASPEGRTADGFETQFGTNHLAHFLLFNLLKPTLLASSTPEFHSRVIVLSSIAHRSSEVHFDNLDLIGEYDPWIAYGQSKTANIWMANEIERRYGPKHLHAYSLHPGGINTGLQKHVPEEMKKTWAEDDATARSFKSLEQGAATTVWAAVAKELEGKGGKYLEDCQVSTQGYAPWAFDREKEAMLWLKSLTLVGLEEDE